MVQFDVEGSPHTQGSKTARIVGKRIRVGGAVAIVAPRAILVEQANKQTKVRKSGALDRWRTRISAHARLAMVGDAIWDTGPCELSCEFRIKRPKSHYTTTGRITRKATTQVPPLDLSKLVRAVEDSLTAIIYRDDVQITHYGPMSKRYALRNETEGVSIKVSRL